MVSTGDYAHESWSLLTVARLGAVSAIVTIIGSAGMLLAFSPYWFTDGYCCPILFHSSLRPHLIQYDLLSDRVTYASSSESRGWRRSKGLLWRWNYDIEIGYLIAGIGVL